MPTQGWGLQYLSELPVPLEHAFHRTKSSIEPSPPVMCFSPALSVLCLGRALLPSLSCKDDGASCSFFQEGRLGCSHPKHSPFSPKQLARWRHPPRDCYLLPLVLLCHPSLRTCNAIPTQLLWMGTNDAKPKVTQAISFSVVIRAHWCLCFAGMLLIFTTFKKSLLCPSCSLLVGTI